MMCKILALFSFIMFNEYRIHRDNLLSNIGDVNDNGEFVSKIKDPKKRLGASLGSLSGGRVNISGKWIGLCFSF